MIAHANLWGPEHAEVLCDTSDIPTWLRMRRPYLGASEVASALGLSPWAPAIELHARKTSAWEESPDDVSEPMRIGNELEPWLLSALERRSGCAVRPAGVLVRSKKYPHMTCTLDGTIVPEAGTPLAVFAHHEAGAVEVKSAGGSFADQWEEGAVPGGPALIPAWYLVQVDAQLAVTGAPFAVFGALLGGRGFRYRWTIVERNEERIGRLVEDTAIWWHKHVINGEVPEPDGSDRASEIIARMYPEGPGGIITLDEDRVRDVETIARCKAEIKKLEAEKKIADQRVRIAIGGATFGEMPDGRRVELSTVKRGAYQVQPSEYRQLKAPAYPKAK